MTQETSRYVAPAGVKVAEGWSLSRLTPPSRLFGANGIRTAPDGRIYVAQVSGSQISAINVDTGAIDVISAKGGDIVAPDDLAFDTTGNLFVTEITEGRVSMRTPGGAARVLQGDMPCANGITVHQGRLFVNECRPGGRIMELSLDGAAPRVLVDDVLMPNGMEVGPDGKLYYPVMGLNEIWRVGLDGGAPEKVAGNLGVPDSVKFDRTGNIVSTQVGSGQVLRVDPITGVSTVLATIAPGLDNVTFVGERIFVSSISGQVNEILKDGALRSVVPDGFNWPLGLAVLPTGEIFVADGPYSYSLRPGAAREVAGMLFTPGIPGYIRGCATAPNGDLVVTTANGHVAKWWPKEHRNEILAEGFDQLYGVAVAANGAVVFAEAGTGRVHTLRTGKVEELASGLAKPSGVAIASDGAPLVAESGAGRVVKLVGGRAETVVDGLGEPQGIVMRGDSLYILDTRTKSLIAFDMARGARSVLASELPVGAPHGVTPKALGPIGTLSGPMGPFAGIAAAADGALYISADAEGSVMALSPSRR